MRQFIWLLIFALLIGACGSRQPKSSNPESGKTGLVKNEPAEVSQVNEAVMWKIASYAGDLGDNKNSNYMTNASPIWGTYSNSSVDHSELKVKFLIDKVSFCVKLYEYGKKIVKKGDETGYNVIVKTDGNEEFQFTAKNVSDRIFINESDAKKVIGWFDKGGKITFAMVNDSKTNPSSYVFALDHPGGFSETLKYISK
jgi:hypothetical protein